jgi:SAM-dependent methyltransferase
MDRDLRDTLAVVEERHWWFEGRRRIVGSFVGRLDRAGPILEVGCGNGANLPLLARFGALSAVEPDPDDRARAQQRNCGPVHEGSLPDNLPVAKNAFQTVLALDVIEHVEDDGAALSALQSLLTPRGTLIVTVPANPWMWSRHDTRNGHFRRYSVDSLRRAMQGSGLTVERISHFNSLLFVPSVMVRVLGRFLRLDGSGTGVPPGPLNWILMKLLASEARLLRHFDLPFGVSLIAIARRDSTD